MAKKKKSIVTNSQIENNRPHYYSLTVNNLNEYKFNTMQEACDYTKVLMLNENDTFIIVRREGQLI